MIPCPACARRRAALKAFLAALLGLPVAARAHLAPGQQPGPNAAWWRGAVAPKGNPRAGGSCCDLSDGHVVQAELRKDGWWFLFGGKWWPVPENTILKDYPPYEDGSAVAWLYKETADHNVIYDVHVYCFVPPYGAG